MSARSAGGAADVARRLRIMMLGLRGIPGVQGGVERHVEHLAQELVELGCEVEVVERAIYVDRARRAYRGVSLRPLWCPKSRSLEAIVHTALGVAYAGWRRPDIVHIHAIGPALLAPLARLFGLRVVVTHHGFDYDRDKWGSVARTALRLGERAGMRFAHGRIAVSKAIAAVLEHRYRVPVAAIPNGVALPPATQSTDALRTFSLEPRRYVLSVGRLVKEKRQLDLIAAFRRAGLGEWKLAIVGASDHPDAYTRAVERAACQTPGVVMTGFQTGEPLTQLFAHAGLFALPSSHEGLPIALLEALAHGLPAIASDIPANRELQLDPSWYFPVGDVDALARGLRRLCEAPLSDAERAALKGRTVRDHDHSEIARRTLAAYLQLCGDRYGSLYGPAPQLGAR